MNYKKQILLGILGVEVILYASMHIFSKDGIIAYMKKDDHKNMRNIIRKLTLEIDELNYIIHQYKMYPFFKEKIAREKLQMAKKDEIIIWYA